MSLLNELDETKEYSMELMKGVRTFLWSPGPASSALRLSLSDREQTNLEVQLLAFVRGQVDIAWEYGKQRARKLETDARDHAERGRLAQLDEIRQRVMDILDDANRRVRKFIGPLSMMDIHGEKWVAEEPVMTPAELDKMMAEARAKGRPPVGPHVYLKPVMRSLTDWEFF